MDIINKLSELTCIALSEEEHALLRRDVQAIMLHLEQLKTCDTTDVAPLLHPFEHAQHLRDDEVTETDCSEQLGDIAPAFTAHLYEVPKVLDNGN